MKDKQELITAVITLMSAYDVRIHGGNDDARRERATLWVEQGFDAVTAYPWLDIGCWNADTAKRFIELGLSAGQVARTVAKMVADGERAAISGYGKDILEAACHHNYSPSRIARFASE